MSTSLAGAAPRRRYSRKLENARVAIVEAEWNGHITSRLTAGAKEVLKHEGFAEADVEVSMCREQLN